MILVCCVISLNFCLLYLCTVVHSSSFFSVCPTKMCDAAPQIARELIVAGRCPGAQTFLEDFSHQIGGF